jgi:hypothetical protein
MQPVQLTHDVGAQTAQLVENQQYVLHISGGEGDVSATIRWANPGPPGAFHNAENPQDVNQDQRVSPLDALIVISQLNETGARILVGENDSACYVDVSGDGYISPIDVLLVVDRLNRGAAAEGERQTATAPLAAEGEATELVGSDEVIITASTPSPLVVAPAWNATTPQSLPSPTSDESRLEENAPPTATDAMLYVGEPTAAESQLLTSQEPSSQSLGEDPDEDSLEALLEDLAADVAGEHSDGDPADHIFARWR